MSGCVRRPNAECSFCHKSVYKRPGELKKYRAVYCSKSCYGAANTKWIFCLICNEKIPTNKHSKTCSRSCSNKARTGMKYKQAGRPKSGSPPSRTSKSKYLTWLRGQVAYKYGYKCSRCSFARVPILEVHHIIHKSNGGTDDIDNLELICPNCHAELHYLDRQARVSGSGES